MTLYSWDTTGYHCKIITVVSFLIITNYCNIFVIVVCVTGFIIYILRIQELTEPWMHPNNSWVSHCISMKLLGFKPISTS